LDALTALLDRSGDDQHVDDAQAEAITLQWMIEVGLIKPLCDFPTTVRAIWPGAEVMSPSDAAERQQFFAEVAMCREANAVIYSGKRRR